MQHQFPDGMGARDGMCGRLGGCYTVEHMVQRGTVPHGPLHGPLQMVREVNHFHTGFVYFLKHMLTLKFALRTLFKTPFVTAVAIVSLALGIGANAAIFS